MMSAKMNWTRPGWKKFTASAFSAAAIILCLLCPACNARAEAQERLVILAPAAADVVNRLGAADLVIGVTNSVAEFPQAARVGTHRGPEIEKIAALKPTLLITTAEFDPALAQRLGSAARAHALSHYGREQMWGQYQGLLPLKA